MSCCYRNYNARVFEGVDEYYKFSGMISYESCCYRKWIDAVWLIRIRQRCDKTACRSRYYSVYVISVAWMTCSKLFHSVFLFPPPPIMQWTTVQFWIVNLVTSTILRLKAIKRFSLSSRSSDLHTTLRTSLIVSIPTTVSLGKSGCGRVLVIYVAATTDQCYIFSHFSDVESIPFGSQNTPTLP